MENNIFLCWIEILVPYTFYTDNLIYIRRHGFMFMLVINKRFPQYNYKKIQKITQKIGRLLHFLKQYNRCYHEEGNLFWILILVSRCNCKMALEFIGTPFLQDKVCGMGDLKLFRDCLARTWQEGWSGRGWKEWWKQSLLHQIQLQPEKHFNLEYLSHLYFCP